MKKQPKSRKTSRANPEWTAAMIAKARPARKALPKIFGARTAATMLAPARVTRLEGVWRKIESLGITGKDVEDAVRQARKRR